jgi:hypothetical protein
VVVHHQPFEFSGTTTGASGDHRGRAMAMFVYDLRPGLDP